jgi:hypothetical protein
MPQKWGKNEKGDGNFIKINTQDFGLIASLRIRATF